MKEAVRWLSSDERSEERIETTNKQNTLVTELLLKLIGFDTAEEHRLLNQWIMDEYNEPNRKRLQKQTDLHALLLVGLP